MLLADAFVTGWHATVIAGVTAGSTVAVFGAGTIGLLSAYSAMLKGASEVYVVDRIPDRLDKAREIGVTPIDFTNGDPVAQIKEIRHQRGLPFGEEVMDGVEVGIDAVGFQAHDRKNPSEENPRQVVSDLARLVNPAGRLGIAGVYTEKDLHPAANGTADGHLEVPWATLFSKGVTVGFGRTHDRRYTVLLRDMVTSGRAKPSVVVTHHGTLEDAPAFFEAFDQRKGGVIKAILQPNRQ